MTRNGLRWLPAIVVPAVIAAGALAVPWQAGAAVDLPEKSPQDVLALAAGSTVDTLSGTIEQSSNLGLPELPEMADPSGEAAGDVFDVLTGSHTARVYLDGPDKARLQVEDRLGERDLILNGTDAWFYDFDDNEVVHATLPTHSDAEKHADDGMVATPQQLAQHFLSAVEPSTTVSLDRNVSVADRPAYSLVLTPRASETLTRSVEIAVDAESGLPLAVEVRARGQEEPAFQVAFTSLSFATPEAELFAFVPPEGATVTEAPLPAPDSTMPDFPEGEHPELQGLAPTVIGSGWDAVLSVPAMAVPPELLSSPLLDQVSRNVDGGRVFSTALLNVLLADDGRVFVGSVPLERLQTAAGR
jgi:outer membrane lipoprotein-sorting protein